MELASLTAQCGPFLGAIIPGFAWCEYPVGHGGSHRVTNYDGSVVIIPENGDHMYYEANGPGTPTDCSMYGFDAIGKRPVWFLAGKSSWKPGFWIEATSPDHYGTDPLVFEDERAFDLMDLDNTGRSCQRELELCLRGEGSSICDTFGGGRY